MRLGVFIAAVVLTLVWIGVAMWVARHAPRFDVSGLHGIGVFLIVPALVLSALGLWVRVALGLVCAAAFIYFSVLVAGQISN